MASKIRPFFMTVVLSSIVCVLAAKGADPARAPDARALKLETLLKERRDTLRAVVEIAKAKYRTGRVTCESVMTATNSLLEAELELATTNENCIAIHKQFVDNHRWAEEQLDAKAKEFGFASPEARLKVKAARLMAEIRLVRAEMSE
jgi:hypothetical protein